MQIRKKLENRLFESPNKRVQAQKNKIFGTWGNPI